MPLQLLGKKSWNVYNPDNVARVRKDEAAAQAQEEGLERRWRENDASRRLQLLRGQEPTPVTEDDAHILDVPLRDRVESRKERRIAGENDTDRDIRLARENLRISGEDSRHKLKRKADSLSDEHTQIRTRDKNKPENENEIQGMRFKDAAGLRQESRNPWYARGNSAAQHEQETVGRDVWGNEDPRRHEREQQRISLDDPLLAMKRGVKKLRENEREKKEWIDQRQKDLYEVEQLAREDRHKRRHHGRRGEEDLEGFNLDKVEKSRHSRRDAEEKSHSKHRRSHHQRHRHRSASPRRGNRQHAEVKERREAV